MVPPRSLLARCHGTVRCGAPNLRITSHRASTACARQCSNRQASAARPTRPCSRSLHIRRYSQHHGQAERPATKDVDAELPSIESIRQTSDGKITTSGTKDEKTQVSTASEFFNNRSKFLYSAGSVKNHPFNDQVPEIVVLGASNVGKSSFLNALMGKGALARVSQKPGHTTLMNAYGVGPLPRIPADAIAKGTRRPSHSLIIMDTPGYGFRSQSDWGSSILKYLEARKMLQGAVLLISSEKKLMPQDKWMLRSLAESQTRTLVVLTKADKNKQDWRLKCGELAKNVRAECRRLERQLDKHDQDSLGWSSDVHITAAKLSATGASSNGGGMGGAKVAILDMAGFNLHRAAEQKPENITYTEPVVSFDDIVWKT